MKKRLLLTTSLTIVSFSSLSFIVSCSSSPSDQGPTKHSKEYIELKKIIDSKKVSTFFKMKPGQNFDIKNIEKMSKNNFLEKVELTKEFVDEDKENSFNAISFVNLVPEENSKNLLVVAFLGSGGNDSNVLQMGKIDNALVNNFQYSNKIELNRTTIEEKDKYKNTKELEEALKKMKDSKGEIHDILTKAFEGEINKIIGENFDKFDFKLDSNQRLVIRISNNSFWNQGTVFKYENEFTREIVSSSLIINEKK